MNFKVLTMTGLLLTALTLNTATAATHLMRASALQSGLPDFTVRFDDINGNYRLGLAEIQDFSGISLSPRLGVPLSTYDVGLVAGSATPDYGWYTYFTVINALPNIEGQELFEFNEDAPVSTSWAFFEPEFGLTRAISYASWSYDLEEIPLSVVPIPAALPLFGGALGLIALMRRWRNRRPAQTLTIA